MRREAGPSLNACETRLWTLRYERDLRVLPSDLLTGVTATGHGWRQRTCINHGGSGGDSSRLDDNPRRKTGRRAFPTTFLHLHLGSHERPGRRIVNSEQVPRDCYCADAVRSFFPGEKPPASRTYWRDFVVRRPVAIEARQAFQECECSERKLLFGWSCIGIESLWSCTIMSRRDRMLPCSGTDKKGSVTKSEVQSACHAASKYNNT